MRPKSELLTVARLLLISVAFVVKSESTMVRVSILIVNT